MGGLLEDERVGYAEGPDEEEVERMDIPFTFIKS